MKRKKSGGAPKKKSVKSKKADEANSKSSRTVKKSSVVKSAAKKSVKVKARKKVAKKTDSRKPKQKIKTTRPKAVKPAGKKTVKVKAAKKAKRSVKKVVGKKAQPKAKQKTQKTRGKSAKAEVGHPDLNLEKTVVPHVPRVEGVSEDQEAKFVLGSPEIIDESWKDPAWDLPESYGDNRVALIARDPRWVFCYWEIGPEAREEGLRALGKNPDQTHWNLRIYGFAPSAPGEKNIVGDVPIDFSAGKSYLELFPSGAAFQVELGLMDEQGNFVPIAVSNRIDLPPDRPSETVDEQWMPDEWFLRVFYDSIPFSTALSGKSARDGSKRAFGVSSFSQYAARKK